MSYVEKDDMTTLRTAAQSLETSQTSEDTVQLKAVAYEINSAANTGSTRIFFQDPLRGATKAELESKGYTIKTYKSAQPEGQTVISWENA